MIQLLATHFKNLVADVNTYEKLHVHKPVRGIVPYDKFRRVGKPFVDTFHMPRLYDFFKGHRDIIRFFKQKANLIISNIYPLK